MMKRRILKNKNITLYVVLVLCLLFFVAYAVLSVVRHVNYQSFGYDLGINNQVVWRYSTFQPPITTSDPFPGESKLVTHVELVYVLLAPIYWIWSSARMLLIADALLMCTSAIAVFLLARKYKLHPLLCIALPFSYLMFFGVQNAMWFDVHSASFAAGFLAWFIYFIDSKKYKAAWVFLLLAITAKENIGILGFLISMVYFYKYKSKQVLLMAIVSMVYLLFIYLVYFPYIIQKEYLYQNSSGLLSNLNPLSMVDSAEKREAIFYSFASFGFLSLLMPIALLPALGDFATYFMLASDLTASHGIFMHYRVTLAPLLILSVILAIARFRKLNTIYIAGYLVLSALVVQYVLHLPLSYLTKTWFWTRPSGAPYIDKLRSGLSQDDTIVAQNNIIPHISRRDKIYTLYPETKKFSTSNSPCGIETCAWFRWAGKPEYLFVDTSMEWDARHLLTDREAYMQALTNMEKAGIIHVHKKIETAVIYTIDYSKL